MLLRLFSFLLICLFPFSQGTKVFILSTIFLFLISHFPFPMLSFDLAYQFFLLTFILGSEIPVQLYYISVTGDLCKDYLVTYVVGTVPDSFSDLTRILPSILK